MRAIPPASTTDRVGVIVVHGIGEQKPGEHLEGVARSLARGLDLLERRVTVRPNPAPAPGEPGIEILVEERGKLTRLGIHEVYWADINEQNSLGKGLRFWLWGLSAWFTPGRPDSGSATFKATMELPTFPGRRGRVTCWNRAQLFFVGWLFLIAAPVVVAVEFLAKRVFGVQPPAWLTLIVSYVSAVKLYSQAKRHGSGLIAYCNEPPRYVIRRRMIRAIADVAMQRYERWYILAHSQGSVVAYNGLMAATATLTASLDDDCLDRLSWYGMAGPHRGVADGPALVQLMKDEFLMPPWPADRTGKNCLVYHEKLLSRFRGLLTYGSPLDKFAALWPPTASINKQEGGRFSTDAIWINCWDPTDPVGAQLDAFGQSCISGQPKGFGPENIACRASWMLLASHLQYFEGITGKPRPLIRWVGDWLLGRDEARNGNSAWRPTGRACNELSKPAVRWRSRLYLLEVIIVAILLLGAWAYLLGKLFGLFCEQLPEFCQYMPSPTTWFAGSPLPWQMPQLLGLALSGALIGVFAIVIAGPIGLLLTEIEPSDRRVATFARERGEPIGHPLTVGRLLIRNIRRHLGSRCSGAGS